METCILAIVFAGLACSVCFAQPRVPTYKKIQLSDKFYAEGASYADFNR